MMNPYQQLMQALPSDFEQTAYDVNTFQRARKIKTPAQLFQLIMLYCGFDFSLRSCAGIFSQSHGYLSDEAVKKRLCHSIEWIKSLLKQMFNPDTLSYDPALRFVVADATTIQERGAKGTTYRIHSLMALSNLSLLDIAVSTHKVAESLQHYELKKMMW